MMSINDIQISDSLIVDSIYTDSEDVIREDSIDSEQVLTEEISNLKKLEEEGLAMLIDSLSYLSVEDLINNIEQIYVNTGFRGNMDAVWLKMLDDYNLKRLILLYCGLIHNGSTCVGEYAILVREARRRGLRIPEINFELSGGNKIDGNQGNLTNKK